MTIMLVFEKYIENKLLESYPYSDRTFKSRGSSLSIIETIGVFSLYPLTMNGICIEFVKQILKNKKENYYEMLIL